MQKAKESLKSEESEDAEAGLVTENKETNTNKSKNFDKHKRRPKHKKFKGNCDGCGKKGRKAADCWEKEENKNKCPSWWKNKNEQGAITMEISLASVEVSLPASDGDDEDDNSSCGSMPSLLMPNCDDDSSINDNSSCDLMPTLKT